MMYLLKFDGYHKINNLGTKLKPQQIVIIAEDDYTSWVNAFNRLQVYVFSFPISLTLIKDDD